jgi:hypothetical protein
MSNPNILVVCGTVILVGVIAAVCALAVNGDIAGGDAIAILGTIITLGGGALAAHAGVTAGAKAANTIPTGITPEKKP